MVIYHFFFFIFMSMQWHFFIILYHLKYFHNFKELVINEFTSTKVICDYEALLLLAIHYVDISSNIFISRNLIIFSTFSSSIFISPWILYFFLLPLHQAIFDYHCQVSTCHICECLLLVFKDVYFCVNQNCLPRIYIAIMNLSFFFLSICWESF